LRTRASSSNEAKLAAVEAEGERRVAADVTIERGVLKRSTTGRRNRRRVKPRGATAMLAAHHASPTCCSGVAGWTVFATKEQRRRAGSGPATAGSSLTIGPEARPIMVFFLGQHRHSRIVPGSGRRPGTWRRINSMSGARLAGCKVPTRSARVDTSRSIPSRRIALDSGDGGWVIFSQGNGKLSFSRHCFWITFHWARGNNFQCSRHKTSSRALNGEAARLWPAGWRKG